MIGKQKLDFFSFSKPICPCSGVFGGNPRPFSLAKWLFEPLGKPSPSTPIDGRFTYMKTSFVFGIAYYLIHHFSTSSTMRLLQLAVVCAALLLVVYAEDESHQDTHSVEKRSLLLLPKLLLLKALPLLKNLPLVLPLPLPLPIPVLISVRTETQQQQRRW